jgi:hypothetical protein
LPYRYNISYTYSRQGKLSRYFILVKLRLKGYDILQGVTERGILISELENKISVICDENGLEFTFKIPLM